MFDSAEAPPDANVFGGKPLAEEAAGGVPRSEGGTVGLLDEGEGMDPNKEVDEPKRGGVGRAVCCGENEGTTGVDVPPAGGLGAANTNGLAVDADVNDGVEAGVEAGGGTVAGVGDNVTWG